MKRAWNGARKLELLDWTGRQFRAGKRGYIPPELRPVLERLELDVEAWMENVERYGGLFYRLAGKLKRKGQELLLVDRLEDHRHRPLEDLVLHGRQPNPRTFAGWPRARGRVSCRSGSCGPLTSRLYAAKSSAMSLVHRDAWISPEEYLERERHSEVRHEYFAGELFAMAGASVAHNRIAGDIFNALSNHLRERKCEAFINDMKAHIQKDDEWIYYPDVMVNCDPAGQRTYSCGTPAVIFEVLSPETESLDRREKRLVYQSVSSLHTYVLVAQDRREVTVYHRTNEGWTRDTLTAPDAVLELPELEFSLPLTTMYRRVAV